MSGATDAIVAATRILRARHPKGGAPTHGALSAATALERALDEIRDTERGLAEWRTLALAAQAKVKHQSGLREAELVTLLKDILHCSDALAFRPDLHARLLDFGRLLRVLEPRDDFPDDYEV